MHADFTAATVARSGATGLACAAAAAGLAWQDCMLLALAMTLAYRLFLLRMDGGAPWHPLTAALDVLTAGVVVGALGASLLAGVGMGWLGWWQPAAPHPAPTLALLAAAAAWCCVARQGAGGAAAELRIWLCLLGGVLVATAAHHDGMVAAPCVLVASVGLALLGSGWRLASGSAMALLRAGSETP